MTRKRALTFLTVAAALPLAALAVAGGGRVAEQTAGAQTAPGGRPATVAVATTGLGQILVDAEGRTLYLFKKDTGAASACAGECAGDWPPLRTSGDPTAAGGANPSQLGTTKRADGSPQVTYSGHPLYLYEGDKKPGDTNGQGSTAFGAGWYALSPTGDQVSAHPSSSRDGTGY
jgi:predicted lipoprotein with Yx(FWY)xxD motif